MICRKSGFKPRAYGESEREKSEYERNNFEEGLKELPALSLLNQTLSGSLNLVFLYQYTGSISCWLSRFKYGFNTDSPHLVTPLKITALRRLLLVYLHEKEITSHTWPTHKSLSQEEPPLPLVLTQYINNLATLALTHIVIHLFLFS